MKLPTLGVQHPVMTIMLFLGLFLFGALAYQMLPRDVLPDIEMPVLTVVTIYPGASAGDVEQQVTKVLETTLAGISNLTSITSQSKENVSFISLQFDWGSDLDEKANAARDMLEFGQRYLPAEAQKPILMRINSDLFPVVIYGINADESYNDLGRIVDQDISNALRRADGVGALLILGKIKKQLQVELDPFKLKAYNLSAAQVLAALKTENVSIPAGNMVVGFDDLAVTVPGEFLSIDDLENTPISSLTGTTIYLKDIATIKPGIRDKHEVARLDGLPGIGIFVQKQAGANTLEVVNAVRKQLEIIKPNLPADVTIEELMDNSELVVFTLRNLNNTIFYVAIFVIIVVIFFLRKLRSSLIIILTIPFSLIVAFIFMYISGYSVNIFSLMSLAIALGMVIDNAIVVFENISKHIEKGVPPKQAALFGTREMGGAITAATLTTIAVFFPLLFLDGIVGIMFRQLAVITAITLLASLFTALTLTPMLSSIMIKQSVVSNKSNKFYNYSEKIFIKLEDIYYSSLKAALNNRLLTVIISLVIFGSSLLLTRLIGTDYIPDFDAGDLSAVVETRIGASTEETLKLTDKIENIFRDEVHEIKSLYSLTGQSEDGILSSVGFREGKNVTTVFARIVQPEERTRTSAEIAEVLRARIAELPEVEDYVVSGGSLLSAAVLGNIRPIELKIIGTDIDELNRLAILVQDSMLATGVFANIQSTVDRGKPELRIDIDRKKASLLGLNTAMLSLQLRQSLYGASAGTMKVNNEDVQIWVRYDRKFASSPEDIENVMLLTLNGMQVPLRMVANINDGRGVLEIRRENQQRVVYIKAEPKDVSLGGATEVLKNLINNIDVPETITTEFGGQVSEQSQSFRSLYIMFVIGLVLVFMVMASQFESIKNPFIIIFTIPLSITGVIIAFYITGLTLSAVTFLGIIMLLGIVVNNGIVIVDYTNLLRSRGLKVREAIVDAGRSRLRPVLMTSFTTMLGMLPMAVSRGVGSEIWSPLGVTIIGGMFVSTMITLILIPVIYSYFNKD
ncbi:MAG: efflux RND transporter permease subunit [Bacteroidetes bacterium]|nr:efflux RND transporter permease subunit [Bacteroidota bacterium]